MSPPDLNDFRPGGRAPAGGGGGKKIYDFINDFRQAGGAGGGGGASALPEPPLCTGLSPPTLPAGDRINHYKSINYFPPASRPAGNH